MAQKPSIPKGTRDFNPEQVAKRNYIFSTIKSQFQTFGFQPIETPSFENSDTLMGKYGEEGDRLIFKILNSGDFISDYNNNLIKSIKLALRNFKAFIEKNSNKAEKEGFFDNFINVFPEVLRRNKEIKFDERSINLDKLSSDISTKIQTYLDKDFLLEMFVEDDDRYLTTLTIIIFGDFYYELGNKYVGEYISEKALRYDLTVPFARYVVQHQNEIEFPFKRYQMQPVWRADRPQKGRFREFYQCDADVVGSDSLWQEVEFIQLYDNVFTALGLKGTIIKINNRKILSGIAEVIGASDKLIDFTVALDKLDKIGEEKVKEEMLGKGIPQSGIDKLQPLFSLSGDFEAQIEILKGILSTSEEGKKGIEELDFINEAISSLGLQSAKLQLDVTLARGLNYYTGAIFEVSAPEGVKMGSIGGGGRYADLTGVFGLKNVSGVGISFGLDRIYLVLEELGLFPETIAKSTEVMFINFGDKEALFCLKAVKSLREAGVNAELYPDKITNGKHMKKQMNYANKREIPFVVLVGEEEMNTSVYTLKNMITGDQTKVSLEALITAVK
ncbi:histidine--tRNA ligase [Lacinutrix sp. Bg11-31]|uniref:histidine--tRNA ligase n=1 Tax=Lacinutrix sp. Bg11-31 TaxID=2057808 RepID=UPI000C318459|nr:histidine--tRNA ligase [Lacinutrix sp. Bg11-31]AUC81064.1 histidine--tRNA ligase [Lacinutrix sp. Bg11-31]